MRRRAVGDGVVVGIIGYAAVAVFYSVFDQLAARGSLYTVDLLGKAVFRGLRDPSVKMFPIPLDAGAIWSYNALHLAIAMAIGLVVSSLVYYAEDHPERRGIVRLVIVTGFLVTVGVVDVLTAPLRPVLPWWSIVVANALATVLAGWYLVRRHPGLFHRLALATG